jgi:Fe-S-cluster-containing hydrogenase component 2
MHKTPQGPVAWDADKCMGCRFCMVSCPIGEVARSWIRTAEERITIRASGELGLALPDGGAPVDGMACALSPDDWEDLAREILLATPC